MISARPLMRRVSTIIPMVEVAPEAWPLRHRWIVRLLWLHAIGIAIAGFFKDPSPVHVLADGTPLFVLAVAAGRREFSPRARSIIASVGLMTASALLVHLGNGATEMHFHFFVMLGVIGLYQDWRPFLLSIGFVAFHHGVVGTISPDQVFDHASAKEAPLLWAGIHAAFVLAASAVTVISWRIVELSHLTARRELAESERRFRTLIENATDVVTMIGVDGTILYDSPPCERVLGYPQGARVGLDGMGFVHPDDLVQTSGFFAELLANPGTTIRCETRVRHHNGTWIWVDSTTTNLLDDPAVQGIVINFRDVTDSKTLEAELAHQAFHDSLTSLPNREMLVDRVDHALAQTRARGRGHVALLFLDLDDFKTVNDALGHAAGDIILQTVAERLGEAIRPGDTASRLGGDEFAVLLHDLEDTSLAHDVATRLLEVVRTPVEINGTYLVVNGSIGIVLADANDDAVSLLRNADLAMYRAKAQGKGRVDVYKIGMHAAVVERMGLIAELRRGVESGEFEPHYQPIVDLPTGRVVGLEALARWHHPTRGLVPPIAFIGLAEETGLIVEVGRSILRRACADLARWRAELGANAPVLSVNASPRQIEDVSFVEDVLSALRDNGLSPDAVMLEITESTLIDDTGASAAVLAALDHAGIKLVLDDFGTGYSSLSYLERFPVHALKIDKSFVDGLADDSESTSPLVGIIVSLAHQLGLPVTAEGIEHRSQLERLRDVGCDRGQGYLFSKPVPACAVDNLLRSPALAV